MQVTVLCCSVVQLFATPWTIACQAPPSMEFSRQEYWSGLPCPPSGERLDPGIEPVSLASPSWQVEPLPLHHLGSPGGHGPPNKFRASTAQTQSQ